MPKVPLIQFQVVLDQESGIESLYGLDMHGRLWLRGNEPKTGKPFWSELTGPDDSDPDNLAWGRHD